MITVSALLRRKATSSGEPDLTALCSPPPAITPSAPPKPPRITLKNERFIALHMM
mgnify:CR=1 FL=1